MSGEQPSGRAPRADRTPLKRVVEALLFSADRPLSAGRLAQLCGVEGSGQVRDAVAELQSEYESRGNAFRIEKIAGGYQALTLGEFAPYVERLQEQRREQTLSKAALETLAIVAYRQPITRAEIEDIRGVQCGHILRSLVERRLIRITGRKDELGRPMLYGTSRQFLEAFGMGALSDLPRREQFRRPGQAPDAPPG